MFELRRVIEVELELPDERSLVRVELLRSLGKPTRYRARLWRLGLWRLRAGGRARGPVADESMWTDWSHAVDQGLDAFRARSEHDALATVLRAIDEHVLRVTGAHAGLARSSARRRS